MMRSICSLTYQTPQVAGSVSGRPIHSVPSRSAAPFVEHSANSASRPFRPHDARPGPVSCAARRREQQPNIEDMNIDQRLERLDQLTNRVGELRSVYDRRSMLRELGVLDPALYPKPEEASDQQEPREPPGWLDWSELSDAREHVLFRAAPELLPDGLRQRLFTTSDVKEGETVLQVPLHNCLVLYMCEGLEEDSLEREEAANDFVSLQHHFFAQWEAVHGPLSDMLKALLSDFTVDAPNSRGKMALWLLWVADHCDSTYWRETLGALAGPDSMPQMEFCSDVELLELQWLPYSLSASVRRETLRKFYTAFGASKLAQELGWYLPSASERPPDEDPYASVRQEAMTEFAAAFDDSQLSRNLGMRMSLPDDVEEVEDTSSGGAEAVEGTSDGSSRSRKGGRAKGGKGGKEGGPVEEPHEAQDAVEGGGSVGELKPLPPFERFLWAYCHAEARSLGNGERLVFFPQADPCIYTADTDRYNTTLAVVADEGAVVQDQFAVLAAISPLRAGEAVFTAPPFAGGPAGGVGATEQYHTQFGMVPDYGGSEADIVDLQPEVGGILDWWLKGLMGQEAGYNLDMVTDPRLRHLLSLAATGDVDPSQLPPLRQMLPPLQLPKLWGPGLVAGIKRVRLQEEPVELDEGEEEELRQQLAAEEAAADEAAARRTEAAKENADLLDDVYTPQPASYKEYEEWRANPGAMTEIVEVPGDSTLWDTPEGRAEWRRMKAAYASLPRVTPDSREHGRCMELAVGGAPLAQVFTSPRDIIRELSAAEALLASLRTVLAFFPTSIQHDEALLQAAAATAPTSTSTTTGSGGGGRKAGGARGGSRARGGSGRSSGSDSDGGEGSAAPGAGRGGQQITSARMRGIVAWRLELKRVWSQMADMVVEYREALTEAATVVEREAEVVA